MRILRIMLVLSFLASAVSAPLVGQREDKEGKQWLSACSEPASINVTGLWKSEDWGRISLSQREGSRNVLGAGDGWEISGVVSGKSVCLLFTHKGSVAYSARLNDDGPKQLSGVYARGLISSSSKTKAMRLAKN